MTRRRGGGGGAATAGGENVRSRLRTRTSRTAYGLRMA